MTYCVLVHVRSLAAHKWTEVLGVYVSDKAAGEAFAEKLESLNRETEDRFNVECLPGYIGSWGQAPRGLHLRAIQGERGDGPEALELHEMRMGRRI